MYVAVSAMAEARLGYLEECLWADPDMPACLAAVGRGAWCSLVAPHLKDQDAVSNEPAEDSP